MSLFETSLTSGDYFVFAALKFLVFTIAMDSVVALLRSGCFAAMKPTFSSAGEGSVLGTKPQEQSSELCPLLAPVMPATGTKTQKPSSERRPLLAKPPITPTGQSEPSGNDDTLSSEDEREHVRLKRAAAVERRLKQSGAKKSLNKQRKLLRCSNKQLTGPNSQSLMRWTL